MSLNRTFTKRKFIPAALLLGAALILGACGGGTTGGTSEPGSNASEPAAGNQGGTAQGSTLRIGLDVDAGTLDPRLAQDTTAYRVDQLIYDGLVQLDKNLKPQPDLAKSWENPDSTTWIFHLRENAKFSNGDPVTAADVAYTYNTLLDPSLKAPHRSLYTPIKQIEAVNDHTVKFILKQPYAPLLSYLDIGIVSKKVAETAGSNLDSQPVGSGPYELKEWDKTNKLVLVPNPNFWGEQPHITKLVFKVVPDNTARAQALEAGDLDLIQSPLSPQDLQRLKGESQFKTVELTGTGYTYFNFNTKDAILSDANVRRALAMLIPQKTIVDQIYQNMDHPATSILIKGTWAYTPDVQQPTYDPDGAKALLAKEGWTDSDGDGILDKNGKKLSIVLSTHSEDPNRTQSVQYLQNVFTKNGIDATTSIKPWPAFLANVEGGKYQIALLGWLNLVDPDRAMYGQLHTGGGSDWGGYSNPEVDTLLDKGRTDLTQDARAKDYQQAAKIVAQEVPYYILTDQGYQVIYNPALKGFVPNPTGSLNSLAKATFSK